ncbi:hypothetical protein V8E36_003416 [Tilletia maclaganii]
MTTFMPHPSFDSPMTTQASFEAFINQSPQSICPPLLSVEDALHPSTTAAAAVAREYSPQLAQQPFSGALKYESSSTLGLQPVFAMDYNSSSAGSSISTASSHHADSPQGSASSHSSISPDLSYPEHARFVEHQQQPPITATAGKFLDFDSQAACAFLGSTAAPPSTISSLANTNHSNSNMWTYSSVSGTPSAGHSNHSRTSSLGSNFGVPSSDASSEQPHASWIQIPSQQQQQVAQMPTIQPLVLSNPVPAHGQLAFNLGATTTAQTPFDLQCSLASQHSLGMGPTPLMTNPGAPLPLNPALTSSTAPGASVSTWAGPTLAMGNAMNGPSAATQLSPGHQRTISTDSSASASLLTSSFVPSDMSLAQPKSAGILTTTTNGAPSAHAVTTPTPNTFAMPTSAPAHLYTFSANQTAALGSSSNSSSSSCCSSFTAVAASQQEQQQQRQFSRAIAGSLGLGLSAASSSSDGTPHSSTPSKPAKRKRTADENVESDCGGGGCSSSAAAAVVQTASSVVGSSSPAASRTLRERKALPKRPPPSASQKTEAGLPFPVVDTSVKHSTLFVAPDTTGLTKREARLVKNRAAAFLSRQRKREQFDELEVRCHALSRLAWRMYETMMGSGASGSEVGGGQHAEVEWDEAALRMGLSLPSSSSSSSSSSLRSDHTTSLRNPHAPHADELAQTLGLKLRQETRTVLAAFEMVVGRKGASIGPLEGELPLEQGPPLGGGACYYAPMGLGGAEPRLAGGMLDGYVGGAGREDEDD